MTAAAKALPMCLAEEMYVLLVAKHINSRSPKERVRQTLETCYARLEPFLQQFDAYRLHLYGRLIGLMRYTTVHDFAGALDVCDDAIQFFVQKPYEARVPIQIFWYEKLICHVHLRQFEAGREAARECAKFLRACLKFSAEAKASKFCFRQGKICSRSRVPTASRWPLG